MTLKALLFTISSIIFLIGQDETYFSPVFDMNEIQPGLNSILQDDLRSHLYFLASEALEGRGTGESGLNVSSEYIAAQFRRFGLTPLGPKGSYSQYYDLIRINVGDNPQLILNYDNGRVKETIQYKEDFELSLHGLYGNIEIEAQVVFTGYGITDEGDGYDDFAGINVDGKIVMIMSGTYHKKTDKNSTKKSERPKILGIKKRVEIAKERGAVAVLFTSNLNLPGKTFQESSGYLSNKLKRGTLILPSADQSVPLITISKFVADKILSKTGKTLEELETEISQSQSPFSFGIPELTVSLNIEINKETVVTQNVAGYLPGSDPLVGHETIVLSAHYDHLGKDENGKIWFGADDNASGTSAIMEIAEAISTNPIQPRRGFLFLAVSGEEKGLLGSKFYSDHPLLPLKQTVANINIDMIGRNHPDTVYVIGSDMISQDLHEINEYAGSKIDDLFLDYKYNSLDDPNRFYYRSDHYNFAKHDIPIVFYFAGIHKDYHKPTDTRKKIDFEKLQKVTRLALLTGWGIAQNPIRIRKAQEPYPEIPDEIRF